MEKTVTSIMMESGPTIEDETKALANQASVMLSVAKHTVITGPEQYGEAGQTLGKIKKKAKELVSHQKQMTRPIDEAKKSILAFFKAPLDYLKEAETLIKRAMLTYENEQARIQREREEEARKIAAREEERQRQLAEKRAKTAEKKGDAELAESIRNSAANYVAPVTAVEPETPKAEGVHTRVSWVGVCDDLNLLLGAIVKGEAPADLVTLNQAALNKIANALKKDMRIAGCRAEEKTILVHRGT